MWHHGFFALEIGDYLWQMFPLHDLPGNGSSKYIKCLCGVGQHYTSVVPDSQYLLKDDAAAEKQQTMELCCSCWALVNFLESHPKCSWWLGFACLYSHWVHILLRYLWGLLTFYLLLTVFRVQGGGSVTSLVSPNQIWSTWSYVLLCSRRSKYFPRYLYMACCLVGVYLFEWYSSWKSEVAAAFLFLCTGKTLNIFWFLEKKRKKTQNLWQW